MEEELDTTGIDEQEMDSYIMTDPEIRQKTALWLKVTLAAIFPFVSGLWFVSGRDSLHFFLPSKFHIGFQGLT